MKNKLMLVVTLIVVIMPYAAVSQMNPMAPGAIPPGTGVPLNPPPVMAGPQSGIPLWNYPTWVASGRPVFSDERWRLAASVSPGYQWMNMTFDFPFSAGNTFNFESMNLKLNSEPFWVGFVGAELQPSQDWILYGRIGGNIPRNTEMVMDGTGRAFLPANPDDPNLDSPPNLTPPWIWTARNFHWWLLEGGVVHSVTSTLALEAGFRVEHLDFELRNPRNFTTPLPGAAGGNRPVTRAIICPRV